MKSLFRTAAAVTAFALSSFAAQAAAPTPTPSPTAITLGQWVLFDLTAAPVTFTFTSTARQGFDLKLFDLGAPGDMFSVTLNGNLIGTTLTVPAQNYATSAALALAATNDLGKDFTSCAALTNTPTMSSQGKINTCNDAAMVATGKGTFLYSYNNASGDFNNFHGAVNGLNHLTIALIQSDTIGNITHIPTNSTIGSFKLVCNDGCRVATIPEPSTFGMLFGGLAVVAAIARRRRNV